MGHCVCDNYVKRITTNALGNNVIVCKNCGRHRPREEMIESYNMKDQIKNLQAAIKSLSEAIDIQQKQINRLRCESESPRTFINEAYVHTPKARKMGKDDPYVIYHYRLENGDGTINNRGGITVVFDKSNFSVFSVGIAVCSENDNFDKKLGVKIAKSRMTLKWVDEKHPRKFDTGFRRHIGATFIGERQVNDYFTVDTIFDMI